MDDTPSGRDIVEPIMYREIYYKSLEQEGRYYASELIGYVEMGAHAGCDDMLQKGLRDRLPCLNDVYHKLYYYITGL